MKDRLVSWCVKVKCWLDSIVQIANWDPNLLLLVWERYGDGVF